MTIQKAASEPIAHVADQLDLLARANQRMARELAALTDGRRGPSQATLERLADLVNRMRPAAAARSSLADLDQDVLLAGVREWQRRRAGAVR